MPDYGAMYADRQIASITKELKATYRTAQRELKEKLADFNKRFEKKNAEKRKQIESGEITAQQYRDWLTGQVFMRNQWESNIRQVNAVLHEINNQSLNLINSKRLDVFAENYNFNAFRAERETGISFGLYNAQAVAQLVLDDPQLLPEWKIDEEKDYTWNYKKVNNIVKQGIIQGEGVQQITDRLCRDLCTMNENKMKMFARTALTEAQSAGRQQQMQDAHDMGIEVKKQWLATLDGRTRDSHRYLDGKEVPFDKPFKSEFGDIMFPGDPTADAADVFNCRCTIVTIYPKYDTGREDWRQNEVIEGQTYQEWKKGKDGLFNVLSGYVKVTKYDYDKHEIVDLPKESEKIINNASKKVTKDIPALDDYIRLICFGNNDNGNPATFEVENLNNMPGFVIALNQESWKNIDKLKQLVKKEADTGAHIKSYNVESIIAHEYGHGMFRALAYKLAGYNGYGELKKFQLKIIVDNIFTIRDDIIKMKEKHGNPYLSKRAERNIGEYVAEAVSDYYYGERKKISRDIVNYFKEGLK